MATREHLAFLSGSEHRVPILRALREPMRPCELEASHPASRATVQRTLAGFEERGWVRKVDRSYELTAAGRVVVAAYGEFETAIEAVEEVGEVLSLLDVDIPPAAVADATVAISSATTPHAAMGHYTDAIEGCRPERLRGICPVASAVFNEAHQPVAEAGVPIELVIDEPTLAAAREMASQTVRGGADETLSLYVSPEPVSFGLTLLDDRVFVGAYDEQGRFRACIDGTNDALYDWAETVFAEHRERSQPLTSVDSPRV